MPREIKSVRDIALTPTTQNTVSDFKDRLVKLIPSEIVTAYITLQGLITGYGKNEKLFLSISFICLLILTPFYLKFISAVNKPAQIIFTTFAFITWVMASGGFHIMLPSVQVFADNFLGSIVLIIYSLFIPFIYRG